MHCFTLTFTKKGERADHDDRIVVRTHPESSEIFQVVYHTPELQSAKKFLTGFGGVLDYAYDILTSMRYDTDPFECIQVSTAIHPIVLYHVADLDDSDTRDLIMNMLRDSLRFTTTLVSH